MKCTPYIVITVERQSYTEVKPYVFEFPVSLSSQTAHLRSVGDFAIREFTRLVPSMPVRVQVCGSQRLSCHAGHQEADQEALK